MMEALRIAIAFIRVPRLFLSLLLFPLCLGLVLAYVQLVTTGLFLKASDRSASSFETQLENRNKASVARQLLLGGEGEAPPLRICRWNMSAERRIESPPSDLCAPARLDVAILVDDPHSFNPAEYVETFSGATARIHLCRQCVADIVINRRGERRTADVYSLWGLALLGLASTDNRVINQSVLTLLKEADRLKALRGEAVLHLSAFEGPVEIDALRTSGPIILNVVILIVITMWLSLRAHRKILDYFARNGALLPLVASCGKRRFYGALWLITGVRVLAFLTAALPLTSFALYELLRKGDLEKFHGGDPFGIVLWIVTLIVSLAFVTIVASVAELKHRLSIISLVYKYVPLMICFLGAGAWILSLLVESEMTPSLVRVLTATPIVGLVPVMFAPVLQPAQTALVVHALLSALLLLFALRHNTRWFAAHLEEL